MSGNDCVVELIDITAANPIHQGIALPAKRLDVFRLDFPLLNPAHKLLLYRRQNIVEMHLLVLPYLADQLRAVPQIARRIAHRPGQLFRRERRDNFLDVRARGIPAGIHLGIG